MFAALSARAPINVLVHHREPASIEDQPVIRQNRDTLYSSAIVDISQGATLSLPDAGGRYLSVMVVNNDHYINDVFHDAGEHEFTVDRFDTDYVLVAARILVDPNDPADLDSCPRAPGPDRSARRSARPFVTPAYDTASFDTTRERGAHAVARPRRSSPALSAARTPSTRCKHLLGTASGLGRPARNRKPSTQRRSRLPDRRVPGHRRRRAGRWVLVDLGLQRRRLLRGQRPQRLQRQQHHRGTERRRHDHGHFGGCGDDRPNCIPIIDGWNYAVRLYQPRPEVLDGSWTFPAAQPA